MVNGNQWIFVFAERRVSLQSLFLLLLSAVAYAFYPFDTDGSFLDMHQISKDYIFFNVCMTARIEQMFYQISTPKYPLTISMQLTHLGRTSFTIVYSIGSPGNGTYATVKILGVFVDKKTRRPTSLPQWWKEKYSLIQSPSQPPNVYGLKRPVCSISFPVSINYSDTDENCHTTCPFYMRMCYDAFVDGTMRKAYKRINDEDTSRGVKTLELVFKKESLLGDDLNVHSWETDRHDVRELGFEITNGTEICVQAKMEFYKTMYDSSKM